MFLEDKLLEIAKDFDGTNDNTIVCCRKMINACFDSISNSVNEKSPKTVYQAQFKRVNKTWEKVALELESKGKGFILKEGFKKFVESKDEFKGLLF